MRSSGRLDEARLLGREAFPEMAKCGIGENNVNSDKTSIVITHLEYLMTQQNISSVTHEKCISLCVTTLR